MFLSYLQSQKHCFVLLPHFRIVICALKCVCVCVLLLFLDPRHSPLSNAPLEENQELRPPGALIPEVARLQHNPTGRVYDPNLWLWL